MRHGLRVFGFAMVGVALVSGPAVAQEKKDSSAPAQEMPIPKPGPEHEILAKDAGVWDASLETTDPTGKTQVSKCVETNVLLGNGLWIVSDFKGELMGMPFEGHGVTGYDPARKKYVGTWVDSMSTAPSTMEGTYDAKTKTMVSWMEGPGPDGKPTKMRTTQEWKADGTRVFTMHAPGTKGDEPVMMKITYKRRAGSAGARTRN